MHQRSRAAPGAPHAFNALPRCSTSHDALDLLEQFGTTLIVAVSVKSMPRVME